MEKNKFETFFENWKELEKFSGVIVVENEKSRLYEKIQGYRNKGERLPNEIDTAFGIASGTKLFTAVAICQLIDKGVLTLDTKCSEVVSIDLKKININTTIQQLLTHTSGIIDYFRDDEALEGAESVEDYFGLNPAHQWETIEYYLPKFIDFPHKFEPGTGVSYSNSGFILLGLIIESVSKMSFHEYVRKNICEPLQLKRTDFYYTNQLPYNTALGYYYNDKKKDDITNTFCLKIVGSPDGGLYSTAEDLSAFWRGIFDLKLFSQTTLNLFTQFYSNEIEEWGEEWFCLGVKGKDCNGTKVFYHDGWVHGVSFITMYCPETGCVASILGNINVDIFSIESDLMDLVASGS